MPRTRDLAVDLNMTESPQLIDRRIWYAYGMGDDDSGRLMENYTRWAIANRFSVRSLMQTGHSYGNIIGRNAEAFDRPSRVLRPVALTASGIPRGRSTPGSFVTAIPG